MLSNGIFKQGFNGLVVASAFAMGCVPESETPPIDNGGICPDGRALPPNPRLVSAVAGDREVLIHFTNTLGNEPVNSGYYTITRQEITPGQPSQPAVNLWSISARYEMEAVESELLLPDAGQRYPLRPGARYRYTIIPQYLEDFRTICSNNGLAVELQMPGTYRANGPTIAYSAMGPGARICAEGPIGRQFLTSEDVDCDGVMDAEDNCRVDRNSDQADQDRDGIGDACETTYCINLPNPTAPINPRIEFSRMQMFDSLGNSEVIQSARVLWDVPPSVNREYMLRSAVYYDADGVFMSFINAERPITLFSPDTLVNRFPGGRVEYSVANVNQYYGGESNFCASPFADVSAEIPDFDRMPMRSPIQFVSGHFDWISRTLVVELIFSGTNVFSFEGQYRILPGAPFSCITPGYPAVRLPQRFYSADTADQHYIMAWSVLEACDPSGGRASPHEAMSLLEVRGVTRTSDSTALYSPWLNLYVDFDGSVSD